MLNKLFSKLKSLFTSATILVQPDPSSHFIVEVDALHMDVGAVISQCSDPDQKLNPCGLSPIGSLLLNAVLMLVIGAYSLSKLRWKNGSTGWEEQSNHSLCWPTTRSWPTLRQLNALTPVKPAGHCVFMG